MGLDEAMDILKGKFPGDSLARAEAALVVALTLVWMYQQDIRSLGKEGFCQGTAYQRYHELLEEYKNGQEKQNATP